MDKTGKRAWLFLKSMKLQKKWDDLLVQLCQIAATNYREAKPTIAGLEGVLKELALLQKKRR